MKTNEIFSSRLKTLMIKRKLKQIDFVKKLDIPSSTINYYFNGKCTPKIDSLLKICKALDTTPNYLLGFDKDE